MQTNVETYLQVLSSDTQRVLRRPAVEVKTKTATPPLAITISRQTGSGAHCIAQCLARYLQSHPTGNSLPWTVFDRNLVDKVLEDHNLPPRLARFLPEDRVPEWTDALDELIGL